MGRVSMAVAALLLAAASATAGHPKYWRDFEYVRDTVAKQGAAVASKKIDWKAACARFAPRFRECDNDVDHVLNVRRLLAVLRDSHTGVTRHRADSKRMPSKWTGLYGGGLWLGWDRGVLFLQGLMTGHPLEGTIPLGSVLCALDGTPTWLWLEREKRRITEFSGSSSDHSLFGAMDNRLLPFGDKQALEGLFLTPKGKFKRARIARWGPGGKAFYPGSDLLPEGLAWARGAVSKMLDSKTGYLRITGSMDAATITAFHAALDRLKGMEALILDCRRMGGGGDGPAWEMAGRFFPKGANNGRNGRIAPSGTWQFEGPVVMFQDEVMVSSAETFTWAMTETERVVSVGRPTGGWSIIPRGFSCPSGIVSFRLGVTDRPTPIRGIRSEGVGWPADVSIPYGPVVCGQRDPVFEIGLEILSALRDGTTRKQAIATYGGLFRGEISANRKAAPKRARFALADLKARLAAEVALLKGKDLPVPDALGASRRLADLKKRAKALSFYPPDEQDRLRIYRRRPDGPPKPS